MSDARIQHVGDRVLVEVAADVYEPDDVERIARRMLAAAHRARYMASQFERRGAEPEGSTVGEVEAS